MYAPRTSKAGLILLLLLTPVAVWTADRSSTREGGFAKPLDYWPSSQCSSCHASIYEQQLQSMHERSFTNPVFQAQYFDELLPSVETDPRLRRDARGCIACHSPIGYILNKGKISAPEDVDPEMSGVTCDFCHTIEGYLSKSPGNGNYASVPSNQKLGPFYYGRGLSWHRRYSELHTKSEFCAICHSQVNRHGLEIKATFTEWEQSPYQERGIECQDCHMNVQGFLTGGEPVYQSGQAAQTSLASPPYRSKIYTHRFHGAHSRTQVVGALTMKIEVEEGVVSAGDEIELSVFVDNSRTGHKMPSGSAELRFLSLELRAYAFGDRAMRAIPIPVSASLGGGDSYGIFGGSEIDRDVSNEQVTKGSRVYRSILVDGTGEQTLSSYNATRIIFDNRLSAAEIRKEVYRFKIPEDAEAKLMLFADLYYFPYPDSFAERLGLQKADGVVIASAKKTIALE
jgi:hypothetical protein